MCRFAFDPLAGEEAGTLGRLTILPTTGEVRSSSIDDIAAWCLDSNYATINSTVSRPRTGKVAVKVINSHGDEVTKVLAV